MKNIYVADFETTVFEGQDHTEVWAAAIVKLHTEEVEVTNSIEKFFSGLERKAPCICYFHNLKFDGSFILNFLLRQNYKPALDKRGDRWLSIPRMPVHSFTCIISDLGQWYKMTIKTEYGIIEIRDSYKLLPFSLRDIGRSFHTKHQKTEITYEGERKAGEEITAQEREYIQNDVLVIKEALEMMFQDGHTRLTIGSCCLSEYNQMPKTCFMVNIHHTDKTRSVETPDGPAFEIEYDSHFTPNLYKIPIECDDFESIGDYVRECYRGGWCYVAKGKENKIFNNGLTLDVNSLYPSVMHSESGNFYPVGLPLTFNTGSEHLDWYLAHPSLFYIFLRVKTRFRLRRGFLPFMQIKGDLMYPSNTALESSDVYSRKDGRFYSEYIAPTGERVQAIPTLSLTGPDWLLFRKHYVLDETEILDYCVFQSARGMFDSYIDKYRKIKMESEGAQRQEAKLFLNNLYGKMAASTNSDFKVGFLDETGALRFSTVLANDKKPGYIAQGAAITSYARIFTITAAQKNYHGVSQRGFIYADTDSIHCDLSIPELKGVNLHDSKFLHWKVEKEWKAGLFVRAKSYLEIDENNEIDIKCAGMPQRCKQLFISSVTGKEVDFETDAREKEFLKTPHGITDFKIGLQVPGKLVPRQIPGGVVLMKQDFTMNKGVFL